jgi:TonB family protein
MFQDRVPESDYDPSERVPLQAYADSEKGRGRVVLWFSIAGLILAGVLGTFEAKWHGGFPWQTKEAADTTEVQAGPDTAATESTPTPPASLPASILPGAGEPMRVSRQVMEAHIISAPVPIYPEAARAGLIEGRVVIQAIVSKRGYVRRVHVVSGDPALRESAVAAIATWRYRPYLANGEPVDVSTQIAVDFRLKPAAN